MKDKLEKEFNKYAIRVEGDNELINVVYVREIIKKALTTQKESFIKIIRETRKNIWAGLHERQEWAIKDEVIEHIDKMIAELERKI